MNGNGREYSKGLQSLPPYLFADLEAKMTQMKKDGVDIISFGIGDPDLPTPQFILDAIAGSIRDPKTHQYPSSQGEESTRNSVANWYKKRFNIELDPATEICITIGSKESIANFARAFLDPGDKVLVPDPAYPVYRQGAAILTNSVPIQMPLLEENDFLPELELIKENGREAKLMYLNYPNNPISATAPESFLKEVCQLCEDMDIILCYDNAYSEFTFDKYKAPSILEFTPGAIEFHSVSKTFNMTGHRIGMAVGDEDLVEGLKKVKSQIDSGAPQYLQHGAAVALDSYPLDGSRPDFVNENMTVYQNRRDQLVEGLQELGMNCNKPQATFYLWVKVPIPSIQFSDELLKLGIVCTPGVGFGEHGEGYVRFALTQPRERINEALTRLNESKVIERITKEEE
jgi:LL-diaminopimelate aminotransferase